MSSANHEVMVTVIIKAKIKYDTAWLLDYENIDQNADLADKIFTAISEDLAADELPLAEMDMKIKKIVVKEIETNE